MPIPTVVSGVVSSEVFDPHCVVQRKINHEALNFLDVEALAGAEKNPPEGSTSGRLERLIKTYFTVYYYAN